MADRKQIEKAFTKEYKYIISSILIDEFGYSVYDMLPLTPDTLETDVVIVAYSVDYIGTEVVATTHFITLAELLNADTVIFGTDQELIKCN